MKSFQLSSSTACVCVCVCALEYGVSPVCEEYRLPETEINKIQYFLLNTVFTRVVFPSISPEWYTPHEVFYSKVYVFMSRYYASLHIRGVYDTGKYGIKLYLKY